jgi:hypothetical protein
MRIVDTWSSIHEDFRILVRSLDFVTSYKRSANRIFLFDSPILIDSDKNDKDHLFGFAHSFDYDFGYMLAIQNWNQNLV